MSGRSVSLDDDIDPWALESLPREKALASRLGLDFMSAGQRYTVVITLAFALLVLVFHDGSTDDDTSFLSGITDSPAAAEAGLFAEVPAPAPAMPAAAVPTFEPAPAPEAPATTSPPTTGFEPAPAPSSPPPSSPPTTEPPSGPLPLPFQIPQI